jgi:cyclopropane fatty-acyl-phospholipid synthase-like methyltransferase
MKHLHAADWEEIARRQPYFRVLTHDGSVETIGNDVATDAFFETGEADIAALIPAIASLLGREPSLGTSLDFGCGAGRLTIPLARRSTTTVACDIAPTMVAHAAQNVRNAGLQNVAFVGIDDLTGPFDFICSLLVFQYIPPSAGYSIIRSLLNLLAPGGVAALHVVSGSSPRSRFMQRAIKRPGCTATNVYDDRSVDREIEAAGARLIGRFSTQPGTVLIIEKSFYAE